MKYMKKWIKMNSIIAAYDANVVTVKQDYIKT